VRLAAVVVLAVVVLALVVAGCGGGGGGVSAEEAWAEGVCSSIASWQTEVETIATDAVAAITEPGATRATVEAAIDDGLAATRTLVDDLRASIPPETPDGDEAKAELEAFVDDVSAANDEVENALEALPDTARLPQVITELSSLATTLQQTIVSGRTLVTDLQELGGEIRDGFENAGSCQELRDQS